MKIISIVGARPQFVKAAVVSRAFSQREGVSEKLLHSGQHFDANMSDVFFEEMRIPHPFLNLSVHGAERQTVIAEMQQKMVEVLEAEHPDWVLVYGDTNTTLAGARAAGQLKIPLAHVEAGLRSFNSAMPEEDNRIRTDHMSQLLFCPSQTAVNNLAREGISGSNVVLCGDVMQDAALFYKPLARKPRGFENTRDFVLCTVHRAETTDDAERLRSVFAALEHIAAECEVVIPLHPRTRKCLEGISYRFETSSLHFTDPLGYLEMVWLLERCQAVLTDSGGLQKEAYFFRKPCVILRNETEWVELVECGSGCLAGTEEKRILECFHAMLSESASMQWTSLYGDGDAGLKIVDALISSTVR